MRVGYGISGGDRTAMEDLGGRLAITGIGESAFSDGGGNRSPDLIEEACRAAIDDAGLAVTNIDGAVVDSEFMPEIYSPLVFQEAVGTQLEYMAASLPHAAGLYGAPLLAAQAIRDGLATAVITYFGVNWGTAREEQGTDEGGPFSYHAEIASNANLEFPFGYVNQPIYFAGMARRHMYEYGTTTNHLGEVAVQTRANAAATSTACRREPLTLEDYQKDRILADPFRVHDCCLVSDGAVALVMTDAREATAAPSRPVYVEGVANGFMERSPESYHTQRRDLTATGAAISGPRAFEMADLDHDEVDLLYVYDNFTIGTVMHIEDLGFCPKGDGGAFVAKEGITVADGALPTNTHGGSLSNAYLLGANHLTEAVRQLRHTADNQVPDADTAVVAGPTGPAHTTLVLGREPE